MRQSSWTRALAPAGFLLFRSTWGPVTGPTELRYPPIPVRLRFRYLLRVARRSIWRSGSTLIQVVLPGLAVHTQSSSSKKYHRPPGIAGPICPLPHLIARIKDDWAEGI